MYPHKDVEFIVEPAVIVLVENLQPDKHVEDHTAHFIFWIWEEFRATEVQDKRGGDLEEGLADDHFPHCEGDYGGCARGGLAVEDFVGGGVGGEGEGGEGVPVFELASCNLVDG
jgi:hypothetical protein